MRLVIDSLVALMLSAVLAGVVLHSRSDETTHLKAEEARQSVKWIGRQLKLKAALGEAELNERGHPVAVDLKWFSDHLPNNPLVDDSHPWLEIVGKGQMHMDHPPDRVAMDPNAAKFWYNPANGVIRARVPATVSDARALELYNTINECSLGSLFE